MSTQFISRSDRIIYHRVADETDLRGPGEYNIGKSLDISLPGFIPFGSSSRRSTSNIKPKITSPAPGTYYKEESFILKSGVLSEASFRSKSERFSDLSKRRGPSPGPGTYTLKSAIQLPKAVKYIKPQSTIERLNLNTSIKNVPSIPSRLQSNGYEIAADGSIIEAEESVTRNSEVGPGNYDPSIDIKFKTAPAATFGNKTQPRFDNKFKSDLPGPGQYNISSSALDVVDFSAYNPDATTDFVMQMKAARRKPLSVFSSVTPQRSVFAEKSKDPIPGPGEYEIPSAIQVQTKPVDKQFFSSTTQRFKDSQVARSMRMSTAPGAYNPVTSDFDQMKLKLMKKKKLISRSQWSQNIAFDATDSRFHDPSKNDIPPPGHYNPKTSITDTLPRPNIRQGAFGSKGPRFREKREEVVIDALDATSSLCLGNSNIDGSVSQATTLTKPKMLRFHKTNDNRTFRPLERFEQNPPPGAYDVRPSWKTKCAATMMPPVINKHRLDITPGPGHYDVEKVGCLTTDVSKKTRNRKNVMIASSPRGLRFESFGPGPGTYDPLPARGSLIKHSFNIYLDGQEY